MDRQFIVAAAQMGPIAKEEPRRSCVARLIAMLREAHSRGAKLVVFPELALTTFFPRWMIEDPEELAAWFETEIPGPATQPLFAAAADLGVGFYLGYAERIEEDGQARHFNTSILVGPDGKILGKYRKVHLPGHDAAQPGRAFQHLEKRGPARASDQIYHNINSFVAQGGNDIGVPINHLIRPQRQHLIPFGQ